MTSWGDKGAEGEDEGGGIQGENGRRKGREEGEWKHGQTGSEGNRGRLCAREARFSEKGERRFGSLRERPLSPCSPPHKYIIIFKPLNNHPVYHFDTDPSLYLLANYSVPTISD